MKDLHFLCKIEYYEMLFSKNIKNKALFKNTTEKYKLIQTGNKRSSCVKSSFGENTKYEYIQKRCKQPQHYLFSFLDKFGKLCVRWGSITTIINHIIFRQPPSDDSKNKWEKHDFVNAIIEMWPQRQVGRPEEGFHSKPSDASGLCQWYLSIFDKYQLLWPLSMVTSLVLDQGLGQWSGWLVASWLEIVRRIFPSGLPGQDYFKWF